MKNKMMVGLLVTLFAVGTAMAQTPVYSANTVGYKKLTLQDNTFYLLGLNFITENSDTPDDVFGAALPEGATVYIWDAAAGAYVMSSAGIFGWENNDAVNLYRKGFWLYIPDYGGETYEVYVKGEVPPEASGTIVLKGNASGMGQFTLVSLPYPVTKKISELDGLNTVAQEEDTVYVWNGSDYLINQKGRLGWSDPDMQIELSAGFWYFTWSTTDINWTEVFANLVE